MKEDNKMKHTIRILTLLAAMILTAGHVWGTPAAIKVNVTGGSIEFYSTYSNGALSDQIITGVAEAGATVYIKATPDALFTPMGMTFNAYASTGSGVAQARTRNGSNTDPGIGQTIEVSPVAGQPGIFTFTMPANGTNANIDATFAAKTMETVSYIDTDGETKQKEAYVLDGTEVTLGESGGTSNSPKETWYVCKTDLSYTSLNFSSSCNVNIILADGVEMKVENSTATAINCHGSLGLYGQSTGDTKGALIAKSTYTYGNAIESEGGITISHCIVTAECASYGIRARGFDKDITISDSEVTATGGYAIWSEKGGISITGGKVTAKGASYGIRAMGSSKDVTISEAEVTAKATGTYGEAISTDNGRVSITGGTVTAEGASYGIRARGSDKDVTISKAEVSATGDMAIWSDRGGVDITGGTVIANGTSYGIRAKGSDVTISGANVTAKATGTYGEAISTDNGRVSITGGKVTAEGALYGIRAIGSDKDVTISKAEVTATGDMAIWSNGGGVDITGGTVIANGTSYGIRAMGSDKDVTISNSKVEATATGTSGYAIYGSGDVSITGGTVTANGTSYGIDANGDVTISNSEVEATATATGTSGYAIFSLNGDVTISNSEVEATATGTSGYAILCSGDVSITDASTVIANGISCGINASNGVTISGSQVIATSGENGSGITGSGDIVLGWTNTTDFIMASSYKAGYGKAVTTADGKRFMAYTVDNTNPQSPVETPATIISGTVSDLTAIAGKMLRPLEDYYVSIPSGLTIVGRTSDFTNNSTSYYKTTENDEVTIKVGSYDQKGIELIGTNVPANITFNDDFTQATFTITAAYVAITDIRYYTTEVAYVDADGNQATTPAADGETPATKVYILTGTETTIGEEGKVTWYISNTTGDGLEYNGMITFMGNVHLILADNSTMTVKDAIYYQSGSSSNHDKLHIYGQGGTTEGKLTAESESYFAIRCYSTDIIINGGTIIANGESGIFANSITINGGQLTATSSSTDDDSYGIFASSITLNLSKTTDFVCASSYGYIKANPISWQVVDGKVLKYTDDSEQLQLIHSGTLGSEEVAALAGKKITFLGYGGYCGQDNSETEDVDESKNVMWCIAPDDPATEDIDESKTITISGTGYMMYYNSIQNADQTWSNGAPWKAFADEIEAVVIEDGITYVGSNTFAHCPNIKSVDIPMSVNNIGDGAFAGCSNLATVSIGYSEVTSFTIGTEVFPATTTILVPEAVLSDYQAAADWSTYQIAPATRTLFAAESTKLWMTWCDKYEYVKPEGVTVYTVSSVATDKATLAEVSGDVIPAYTPVILYRAAAGEDAVTATFSAVGTAPASGYDAANGICSQSNQAGTFTFFGATTAMAKIPVDANFTYYNGGLTYVLYGDKFLKTDSNNGIAANRCWLKLQAGGGAGGGNARQLVIVVDDDATAIADRQLSTVNSQLNEWYTLDGRKLSGKPTKKGLYIYNGKKTVVK